MKPNPICNESILEDHESVIAVQTSDAQGCLSLSCQGCLSLSCSTFSITAMGNKLQPVQL